MGELIFIGLGLDSEEDISLRGLKAAKAADEVFLEAYTSLMPHLDIARLEELIGKRITRLSRRQMEEEMDYVLREARSKRIAILCPGDPFVATTHIALRIEAEKRGIKTKVINNASIISAVTSATGLQSYKLGRTVTLTFPQMGSIPETVYDVTKDNLAMGLHTLILLEIDVEGRRYLRIDEAVELLRALENRRKEGIFTEDRLIVGLARLGSEDMIVKADILARLKLYDFGLPPHSLLVPGRLHFMEKEALKILASAPDEALRGA